jgi:hypothetical protein
MSTPKVTPWFPADVKPTRKGLYQRQYGYYEDYPDLWTGKRWMLCGSDGMPFAVAKFPRPWRGLASDPKASKS